MKDQKTNKRLKNSAEDTPFIKSIRNLPLIRDTRITNNPVVAVFCRAVLMVEKIVTALGTLMAMIVMVPQGNRGHVDISSQLLLMTRRVIDC